MVSNGSRGNGPPPHRDGEGCGIYAIGDIHGCLDLLGDLHRIIARDADQEAPGARLCVYLGDYVDRGPDPAGVIDYLLDHPLAGFENIYLKGNHEALLLDFLDDKLDGLTWILNGGEATLESYRVATHPWPGGAGSADLRERFARALPARHEAFLRSLKVMHVQGDYCFVHAGIHPDLPLEAQLESDLLWIREPFLSSTQVLPKCIVHGHTVTDKPEIGAWRIGLDTGACITGRLSCAVLDGGERRILQSVR